MISLVTRRGDAGLAPMRAPPTPPTEADWAQVHAVLARKQRQITKLMQDKSSLVCICNATLASVLHHQPRLIPIITPPHSHSSASSPMRGQKSPRSKRSVSKRAIVSLHGVEVQ